MKLWPSFSLRKKTKTTSPQELLKELSGGGDDSVAVNSKTVSQLSTVFSCVRVISESIGMLPLAHFERKGDARSKLDGDLYRLLAIEPNEWMTAQEFWEMCGAKLGFEGNFYAFINWSGDRVLELLPIVGQVTKKQGEDYSVWFEVNTNGKTTMVPQENILHIPLMTLDGIKGVNPVTHLRKTFKLALQSDDLTSKFLSNASRPGGILTTEANLSKEQMVEYQELWEEKHGGGNNFRTAILGNGFKYIPTALSNSDLQFLESRKLSRSEIAGIYRVPPHMIGDMDGATFSNIESQGQSFVTHCLMPYLTRIENRIRKQLIPESKRGSQYVKFNASALMRGDMESRGNFYTKLIQNGALSPNEIRAYEDMSPRPDGDIYLTPMNMLINGQNLTNPTDPNQGTKK
jgi:HK97 family phage portal protein